MLRCVIGGLIKFCNEQRFTALEGGSVEIMQSFDVNAPGIEDGELM